MVRFRRCGNRVGEDFALFSIILSFSLIPRVVPVTIRLELGRRRLTDRFSLRQAYGLLNGLRRLALIT